MIGLILYIYTHSYKFSLSSVLVNWHNCVFHCTVGLFFQVDFLGIIIPLQAPLHALVFRIHLVLEQQPLLWDCSVPGICRRDPKMIKCNAELYVFPLCHHTTNHLFFSFFPSSPLLCEVKKQGKGSVMV